VDESEGSQMTQDDSKDILPGSDQSGKSFAKVDFGESRDFEDVDFSDCNLVSASFSNGYLESGEAHTKHHLVDLCYGSDLRGADLSRADISSANLYGCELVCARLDSAIAVSTDFRRAICEHISGKLARMDQSLISGSNFDHANFEGASFVGAVGAASTIGDGSKYSAEARLVPVSFRNANLRNADFTGADLRGADFTGADLSGANLLGADLAGAILPDRQ